MTTIFELEHEGVKYRGDLETGAVWTWIERRQKASGWQKLKSAPRIKRILRLAGLAANNACCGES